MRKPGQYWERAIMEILAIANEAEYKDDIAKGFALAHIAGICEEVLEQAAHSTGERGTECRGE